VSRWWRGGQGAGIKEEEAERKEGKRDQKRQRDQRKPGTKIRTREETLLLLRPSKQEVAWVERKGAPSTFLLAPTAG